MSTRTAHLLNSVLYFCFSKKKKKSKFLLQSKKKEASELVKEEESVFLFRKLTIFVWQEE